MLKELIMTEKEWMEEVKERLEQEESFLKKKIFFSTGKKVPYSFEVLSYLNDSPEGKNIIRYETDLLVYQKIDNEKWKPRIIIEGKINRVTTLMQLLIVRKPHLIKTFILIFIMVFCLEIEKIILCLEDCIGMEHILILCYPGKLLNLQRRSGRIF
jgi:hypothetical protein